MESIGNMLFDELEKKFNTKIFDSIDKVFYEDISPEKLYFIEHHVNNALHHVAPTPTQDSRYRVLGLSFNKKLNVPPHLQSALKLPLGRNGRDDIYEFYTPTPYSEFLYDITTATILKAKITVNDSTGFLSEWHQDEPINEAIKCVIPIKTNTNYLFQMDNKKPIHLEKGKVYCFDSSNYHRFVSNGSRDEIIHLVFSIPTKYSLEDNEWIISKNFLKTNHLPQLIDSYFNML